VVILVMSCDKNQDLWYPFYHCMEKYWPNHPEVIYSTETKQNPYYKTINFNYPIEQWTKRVRDTVRKFVGHEYVLLMCDDIFIRSEVNDKLIKKLTMKLKGGVAAINFEFPWDDKDIKFDIHTRSRSRKGNYKTSVMCGLWHIQPMLKIFEIDCNPWEFEQVNHHCNYVFLISNDKPFIDFGLKEHAALFGVYQGKWCQECVDFFKQEGLDIDFEQRGITNKTHY